nr:MAG TPA: hypothetical protein [Caudoviricetes sp.]
MRTTETTGFVRSWQSTKGHIARGNTHHLLNDLEFKLKEIQNGNFK